LVLLDIWMPDTDGVSLLKEWASQALLDMPVIMMSGHATIDTAVEATRIGAIDFLEKPITLQRLLKTIAAGLARGRITPPVLAPAPVVSAPVTPPASGGLDADEPGAAVPAAGNGVAAAPALAPATPGQLGSISLDQPLRDARDA